MSNQPYSVRRLQKLQYLKEDRKKNPDKYRNRDLKRNYKLTLDDYNVLVEQQNNCCAICGTNMPGGKYNRLMVDHDHTCCPLKRGCCGKCNRGLLCQRCNIVLGEVNDDILILANMISYIEKYKVLNGK